MLVLLQKHSRKPSRQITISAASFDLVLHVVCRTEGALIARRLLAWMEYLHKSGKNEYALPTRNDYLSIGLDAYANSTRRQCRATRRRLYSTHVATAFRYRATDTFCYNVAKAWYTAKQGRESVNTVIGYWMKYLPMSKDLITWPVIFCLGRVVCGRMCCIASRRILREIEDDAELEPNTVVLNAVMSAWVKSKNPAAVEERFYIKWRSNSCTRDSISQYSFACSVDAR
jgi:hypothetical protein